VDLGTSRMSTRRRARPVRGESTAHRLGGTFALTNADRRVHRVVSVTQVDMVGELAIPQRFFLAVLFCARLLRRLKTARKRFRSLFFSAAAVSLDTNMSLFPITTRT
jgi:hypothetical protein